MVDAASRKILKDAIEGEKRSYALYRAAARRCAEGPSAELLRQLAADELRHMMLLLEHFEGRAQGLTGEVNIALPAAEESAAAELAALDLPGILRYARDEELASIAEVEAMLASA